MFNADILGELLQNFGMGGYMAILYATIIEHEEEDEEEGIYKNKHWASRFGIVGGISIQYTAVAFGYCRQKRQVKQGTYMVYFHLFFYFVYTFCMLLVVQQNLLCILKHYFHFY